jgi:nucleotide-binding universal stress UspA family protein
LKAAQVKASGETRAGLSGEQAKAIVDEASRFDADLIIMGSRGLSDFQALLLGSVAHKVVHYAHCPVLIVR